MANEFRESSPESGISSVFEVENDPFTLKHSSESSTTPDEGMSPPPPESDASDEEVSRRACAIVFVIFVVLVLVGVGAWYYVNRDKEKEPEPTAPTVTDGEAKTEQEKDPYLVSAAKGGHFVFPLDASKDKQFEITIPPGALKKDTKIEVVRVAAANADKGEITDLYHLKPDGLAFLKPVTLAVPYNLRGLKEGTTLADALLQYWKTKGPRNLIDFTIDAQAKKLKTRVMGF